MAVGAPRGMAREPVDAASFIERFPLWAANAKEVYQLNPGLTSRCVRFRQSSCIRSPAMTQPGRVILAIENSNPSAVDAAGADSHFGAGVAVGRYWSSASPAESSIELLALEPIKQLGREADDLMPAVARAVERAGLMPRDIQQVAVSVGPGGYTAVRMACAAGKMIAHAVGAMCAAVPSAWVVAASALPRMSGIRFAVALAGKDDTAYFTVIDSAQIHLDFPRVSREAGILRAADLCELGVQTLYADRFLPDSIRRVALLSGIEVLEPIFDPVACLKVATCVPSIEPTALVPIYPREPDAVTLWRARHAS